MSVIEIDSLAGAIVTVITLISKIVTLITSIQNLIIRLDTMQTEIEKSKGGLTKIIVKVDVHEDRINILESDSKSLKEQLKEIIGYAFN